MVLIFGNISLYFKREKTIKKKKVTETHPDFKSSKEIDLIIRKI